MTTDITELAQREKFEAWWERTQHNGNPPRFGWSHWRDGEGYKVDDDDSELDGMWSAWKAAGAELVEALEKAQQRIAELEFIRTSVDKVQREFADELGCAGDNESILQAIENLKQLAEPRSITVKLPKIRRVKLVSGEYVNGWTAHDVACALFAAGIKVEAE